MQTRAAQRYAQQMPRLRVDGLGNIPLFCAGSYETCAVKIIRENKVVIDDPFGLHVVRDVAPANGAWVRFFFRKEEVLTPGIYSLHWISNGGRSGMLGFVVQDSPFNPNSSFGSLEERAGFAEQMIYRGVTVLPAGETSVIIESPFELNPTYHRPAWALIDRNNKPITGVSLTITEQFPKAWRVQCAPVSDQDRIIDWVVY